MTDSPRDGAPKNEPARELLKQWIAEDATLPRDGAPAPVPAAEQELRETLIERIEKFIDATPLKLGWRIAEAVEAHNSAIVDSQYVEWLHVKAFLHDVLDRIGKSAAALPHAPSPQEEYEGSGNGTSANTGGTSDRQGDTRNFDRVDGAVSQQPDQHHRSKNAAGEDSPKVAAHAPSPPTGWQPLDVEHLPKGRVLLTNNLRAVDAHGRKSHVWYGFAIKNSNSDDGGPVITYDDAHRKIHFLTHYAVAPLPAPPLPAPVGGASR